MNRGRKIVFWVIVIVLVLLGAWFFNASIFGPKVVSTAFYAQVQEVEGDLIRAVGHYLNDDGSFAAEEEVEVQIKIIPDTEIIKELWYIPTKEEREADGGVYYPDRIKKEFVPGSISDFSDTEFFFNFPITVRADKNIFGDKKITASEINYIERIYSELQ